MNNRKGTKMKYWLKVLFTPSCWMQNYPYSAAWDRKLRSLLDTEKFKDHDGHHAKIGNVILWVENHPYASFTMRNGPRKIRPSRATILRAYDKFIDDCTPPFE